MTLLPLPAEFALTASDGGADLSAGGAVVAPRAWWPSLLTVLGPLSAAIGAPFSFRAERGDGTALIEVVEDAGLSGDAYRLRVADGTVSIAASGATGALYALQTLRQLLGADAYRSAGSVEARVPACEIADAPVAAWRGFMYDVARHFPGKTWTLRLIDLLAQLKMNVLHLHLTDDQGWRVEIDAFPRLTEVGAYRRETLVGDRFSETYDGTPHGGYFTKADLREIVAYAAVRGITVVPEIDMPGHMLAAVASYPEWGVTGTQTEVLTRWARSFDVLNMAQTTVDAMKTILDEIIEIFPSEYIHIGGDESPRDQWDRDPATQDLIRERGLADSDALQHWFTRELGDHLQSRGRRMVGWDEILNGELPENATIMAWRDEEYAHEALALGRDVVIAVQQHYYFDFKQSARPDEPLGPRVFDIYLTELAEVYSYDWRAVESDRILGIQGELWTEFIPTTRKAEYMIFPRLFALAERAWRAEPTEFDDFVARVEGMFDRWDAQGVEYRPLTGPRPDQAGTWSGVIAEVPPQLMLSSNDGPQAAVD
ncbi:beta-N-acetylhexosaminidase [Microbacterium sp. 179-I 3D4 NHS]|uniref:beta-N-acetylhexosaminidase n=1 Tax=Microbacterium sp. 179-I 3D4 NHS TaxID=3142381 RepID=UPI0039A18838